MAYGGVGGRMLRCFATIAVKPPPSFTSTYVTQEVLDMPLRKVPDIVWPPPFVSVPDETAEVVPVVLNSSLAFSLCLLGKYKAGY